MASHPIEPQEKEKMEDGYEYLRLSYVKGNTLLQYYDKTSEREETKDGVVNYNQPVQDGWQLYVMGAAFYFRRQAPVSEETAKWREEAMNPPDDLRILAVKDRITRKLPDNVEAVQVEWYRDREKATVYFDTAEGTRHTEQREAETFGIIRDQLINEGYYFAGSIGGREGVVGNFVKYI